MSDSDPSTETAKTIRFNPDYKISCPPPGTGTPEFEKADAEAAAFIAAWRADFDIKTLKYLGKKLSPLAVKILKWARDEMAAAMIDNDHPYVARKMTELSDSEPSGLQRRPSVRIHESEHRLIAARSAEEDVVARND